MARKRRLRKIFRRVVYGKPGTSNDTSLGKVYTKPGESTAPGVSSYTPPSSSSGGSSSSSRSSGGSSSSSRTSSAFNNSAQIKAQEEERKRQEQEKARQKLIAEQKARTERLNLIKEVEKQKALDERLKSELSIQDKLFIQQKKILENQSKTGLSIKETDKFGRSAGWYAQQKLERNFRTIARKVSEALQNQVNAGLITVTKANELLQKEMNRRVNQINAKELKEAIKNIPLSEYKLKLDRINISPKTNFNKLMDTIKKEFVKKEKQLAKLTAGTEEKRILLRTELTELQNKRKEDMQKITVFRNSEMKRINSLPKDKQKKELQELNIKSGDLLENVRKKYDQKGIKLQNKLLQETGKNVVLRNVELAKDVVKIGTKVLTDSKVRQEIKAVTKDLATNKEARQQVKTILKEELRTTGTLIKTSPTEALLSIGGDLVLMSAVGKGFKPISKIAKTGLKGTVKVGATTVKKITFINSAIKKIGLSVRITKQAGKNIVKVTRGKVKKLTPIKVRKELAKREKILKKMKLPSSEDRIVQGVKLGKKEFRSFIEAEKFYNKEKSYQKIMSYVNKVSKSAGKSERISGKVLSPSERKLLEGLKNVPKKLIDDVKSIDVSTMVNEVKVNVPIIKRIITKVTKKGSKAIWRNERIEKTIYQNIVSYGLINKNGRYLGSITYSTISKKPLSRFKNAFNAIKYGSNKQMILSTNHGNNYIKSISKLLDKRVKNSLSEYISKFKNKAIKGQLFNSPFEINVKVPLQKTRVITKRIFDGGSVKKKFKKGMEVSRAEIKSKKRKVKPFKSGKKTAQIIKEKEQSIIIAFEKIQRVNPEITYGKFKRALDKLGKIKQKKELSKNISEFKNKIKNVSKEVRKIKSSKVPNERKLKLINKVSKEIQELSSKRLSMKALVSASQIKPKVKIRKKIVGLKELKKEMNQIKELSRRTKLLRKKKIISKLDEARLLGRLSLTGKAVKSLSKTKSLTKQKEIQDSVRKSLQKIKQGVASKQANSKKTKTTKLLTTIPIKQTIKPKIRVSGVRRIKEKKKLRITSKKKEEPTTKLLSKPQMTYNVYAKKRGRNVLIGKKLIRTDAKNLLAYDLDETLLRSSVIKPAVKLKRVTKLPQKYTGAFQKRSQKLRQYKLKQGKKKAIRGYVEKKRYSLDRPAERRSLSKLSLKKRTAIKKTTTRKKSQAQIKAERLKNLRKARIIKKRKVNKR